MGVFPAGSKQHVPPTWQDLMTDPVGILTLFPASHDFCCLLSHLIMSLGSLYCKQYGPRSGCSLGSGFIVFASMIKVESDD